MRRTSPIPGSFFSLMPVDSNKVKEADAAFNGRKIFYVIPTRPSFQPSCVPGTTTLSQLANFRTQACFAPFRAAGNVPQCDGVGGEMAKSLILLVRTAGLEPATSCSGGMRSIQLSYARRRRSIDHRNPKRQGA